MSIVRKSTSPVSCPSEEFLREGTESLERFLRRGGSPNAVVPGTKFTLLSFAASESNDSAVRLLLQHPSLDVTIGWPALCEAVYANSIDCISALINHPAIRVNATGFYPPCVDPYNTDPASAPPIDRSGPIDRALHPLHIAALFSRTAAAAALLEVPHLNVNPICRYGTPLFIAAARGHHQIISMLLQRLDTQVNLTHGPRSALRALCERPGRQLIELPTDPKVDYAAPGDHDDAAAQPSAGGSDSGTHQRRLSQRSLVDESPARGSAASDATAETPSGAAYGPPTRVLDWLYIGSEVNVRDADAIAAANITRVLCVGPRSRPPPGAAFLHAPMLDDPRSPPAPANASVDDDVVDDGRDIVVLSSRVVPFLEEGREAAARGEGATLVHCAAGVNRSVVIVVMYLILVRGITLVEAWEVVRSKRHSAMPHEGYLDQLSQLEKDCTGEDTRAEMVGYTSLRELKAAASQPRTPTDPPTGRELAGTTSPTDPSQSQHDPQAGTMVPADDQDADPNNKDPKGNRPPPSVADIATAFLARRDCDVTLSDPLAACVAVRDVATLELIGKDPRCRYIFKTPGGRTTSHFDALRTAAIAAAMRRDGAYVAPPLPLLESGVGTMLGGSGGPRLANTAPPPQQHAPRGRWRPAPVITRPPATAGATMAPDGGADDDLDGSALPSADPGGSRRKAPGGAAGRIVDLLDDILVKQRASDGETFEAAKVTVIRSRTPQAPGVRRIKPSEVEVLVGRLCPDPATVAARREEIFKRHNPTAEVRVLSATEEAEWLKRLDNDLAARENARESRMAAAVQADLAAAASPRLGQAELDAIVDRLHHAQPLGALAKGES